MFTMENKYCNVFPVKQENVLQFSISGNQKIIRTIGKIRLLNNTLLGINWINHLLCFEEECQCKTSDSVT